MLLQRRPPACVPLTAAGAAVDCAAPKAAEALCRVAMPRREMAVVNITRRATELFTAMVVERKAVVAG